MTSHDYECPHCCLDCYGSFCCNTGKKKEKKEASPRLRRRGGMNAGFCISCDLEAERKGHFYCGKCGERYTCKSGDIFIVKVKVVIAG